MSFRFTLGLQDRVGPYEVMWPLGVEVYLAKDTRLDRWVTIKLLPAMRTDPDRVQRLIEEAKAASDLRHPNIITIYDFVEGEVRDPDGRIRGLFGPEVMLVVMEPFLGFTLLWTTLYRQPKETLFDLGEQLASALEAAHATGIVHGDLNPGNIRVRKHAKILDFGLARLHPATPLDDEIVEKVMVRGTMLAQLIGLQNRNAGNQRPLLRISSPWG
jgi:eukaryotic-like serine/threonine-protein kinase